MDFFFGKPKTLEDKVKEHRKLIIQAKRELGKESSHLQREEPKLKNDVRTQAKKGTKRSIERAAKSLVRNRAQVERIHGMIHRLEDFNEMLRTVKNQELMVKSMVNLTRLMVQMDQMVSLPAFSDVVVVMRQQTDDLNQKQDLIDSTMDKMFEDTDPDQMETTDIVNSVMHELGISLENSLVETPSHTPGLITVNSIQTNTNHQPQQQQPMVDGNASLSQDLTWNSVMNQASAQNSINPNLDLEERLKRLKNNR